ncbi:Hpt domain-containing protein [Azospira oryzae]|uniref:Hpt domain-containing protein n=1 Tax=Azospira oryzae TaxID=146939 RepID=UPI001966C41C|nr:Hpt domain-containing protein [Azospira oryzae]
MSAVTEFDVGPLTWVKGEIDAALERADQSLQQYLGGDRSDLSQIKFGRTHLHQVHGALAIVGLDGVTQFTEALEAFLADLESGKRPADDAAVDLVRRSLQAIRHYLDDLLNGEPNQPLRLWDLYQSVQQARGLERVNPTDLFFPDLAVRPPRRQAAALPPAELNKRLRAERSRFQRGLLAWLRGDRAGLALMRDAITAIEATQDLPAARSFWWVAQGFITALAEGAVTGENDIKQLCARIDLQIRRLIEGSRNFAERLMRDALYHVAVADSQDGVVSGLKQSFALGDLLPAVDGDGVIHATPAQELVLRRLREHIAAAEEAWGKFCAGTGSALPTFREQVGHLAQGAEQLGQHDFHRLCKALLGTANWLVEKPARHSEVMGMELATGILLAANAQENFEHLGQDFAHQVDVMVARLHACVSGQPAETGAEVPGLDEMSRRAQERLLNSQVAKEIQTNLVQIEQVLDAFFRDVSRRGDLAGLDMPLKQVTGALTILGQDAAVATLADCSARIACFSAPDYEPVEADFEAVASQLSALGFFVEALPRELAKGSADFSAFSRGLGPQGNREEEEVEEVVEAAAPSVEQELEKQKKETQALMEALKEQPADANLRQELKQNLESLQKDADLVADKALGQQAKAALSALEAAPHLDAAAPALDAALAEIKPQVAAAPAPSAETIKLTQASEDELDAELLSIFLEEAQEVLGTIGSHIGLLREQPHNVDFLTTIRRSFHTLKGSGRMVGLKDLGETAWAIEQVLNLWLRQEYDVSPELFALIEEAHVLFSAWVRYLETREGGAPDPAALVTKADTMRGAETPPAPVAEAAPASALPELSLEESTPFADLGLEVDLDGASVDLTPPAMEVTPVIASDMRDFMTEAEVPAVQETDAATALEAVPEIEELTLPELEEAPVAATADVDLALEELPALEEVTPAALDFDFDLGDAAPAPAAPEAASAMAEARPEAGLEAAAPSLDEEHELSGDLETLELPPLDDLGELEMPAAVEPLPEVAAADEPIALTELPAEPAVAAAPESSPLSLESEPALDIAFDGEVEAAPETVPDMAQEIELTPPAPAAQDILPELEAEEAPPPPRPTLKVSSTLYQIFMEEAQGHLEALQRQFGLLETDPEMPTAEPFTRAAHTLGSIAGTIGLDAINRLGRALEHALLRRDQSAHPASLEALEIIRLAISSLEEMVASVAAQQPPEPASHLADALDTLFPAALNDNGDGNEVPAVVSAGAPATAPAAPPVPVQLKDDLDEQLLPIFLEEAQELTQSITEQLRLWHDDPHDADVARALARLLHTLKGSARMAGAMNLGELTHTLETRVEQAHKAGAAEAALIEEIQIAFDAIAQIVERLASGDTLDTPLPVELLALPETAEADLAPAMPETQAAPASAEMPAAVAQPERPAAEAPATVQVAAAEPEVDAAAASRATLRVRSDLMDRLVNEAGELSIARARIEGEMRSLKDSLLDLTENVIRLRRQLREVEIQAETQIQARTAEAEVAHAGFDPLEFDRFTRFQELTRMMAESVNDVATVQQNLLKNLDEANAAIIAQARLNRELQQSLMSVRMVPFSSQTERLHRIVRQTAKEVGKRANLEIVGGQVELDRGVLDKMVAPLEHMLRNSVAHGLESREGRLAAGKEEIGEIELKVAQEGNEIIITMADDGAGLDLQRIRAKAESQGLLAAGEEADDARLADLIFAPGFSTAGEVSQIAGRGVGMDVVRTEVTNLGGRLEMQSVAGKGLTFRIYLPLTLAVTQALIVRVGNRRYAIPSAMIAQVQEVKEQVLAGIRETGQVEWLGNRYPYHFLPHLLGEPQALPEARRLSWVLLLRSGTQRAAIQVDELFGNQEIVVKNVGPQLARVIGIAGATVLGDGQVLLILNPVALAARSEASVAVHTPAAPLESVPVEETPAQTLPTVMVVDDSLTVRKITSRLLSREGYHVLTAKDGVDGLEQLIDTMPDVLLVDIEMPRMDGFDFTRNVRADERLKHLPIIMITSRTADKHRNYAFEIGVNHYLGKPYQEDELLALVQEYTKRKRVH